MKLYYLPISSYSMKTLIAFFEKGIEPEREIIRYTDPEYMAWYRQDVNPLGKVPTLILADGWKIPESSIIIEYIDTHFDSGTQLIPEDKDLARQTRYFDRVSDLYLAEPMQTIFFDGRKPEAEREPQRVASAKKTLDTVYPLLEKRLTTETWAMGDRFTMAECAAAPALFYLSKLHPFGGYPHLQAYVNRLVERPSVARVLREAEELMGRR